MEDLFDINKFNIIEDEENYYFFRALNMADNQDLETGTTLGEDGNIERIRTDRERYEGATKYTENSEISLEEIYDHIKMHYRKDTNCISFTTNANIAVNYGRGSYKDRYVMIKIPKKEFGEKTVAAGQYMLRELYSRIEQAIENLPEEKKKEILDFFAQIEKAKENKSLQDIIAQRYTAKSGELSPDKAHLRKGITYSSPKARISSYQSLDEEQLLEVNKVYAKLAILENEHILEHVIPHSSNSKLRETIGNAFSSAEVIHYGDIKQEYVLEISKEVVDIFALVQQVNGIDKNKLEELKQALIIAVQSGKEIPQIPEIDSKVKDNISIEEMYELTEGKVEYGKANSIVRNMFYLSKSRQNAIALSNALSEILGNDSRFENIIQYIRENGFRVEPEIISRKSGKGVKLSESVNLSLQKEEQSLVDEIRKLSPEELNIVLQNGGLYNAQDIITTTFSNIRENEKIDKSRYYAEAIIAGYNWQDIGIEEFKTSERNDLITRLQGRNCVKIYEKLQQLGIEESQIPTILLNIVTREGFYEQYVQGNLEQLLNTRQDVLQNNINIEVVERFLGYYDIENTGIRLKDYQQRAYDNINKIFEDKKFAQVILPTGAGKSFVALAQMQKYAQEHPKEKMLYLAPQDEILNQIKSYIVKYVHGKQGTVGKTDDEIIAEIFPNITFETYSGLLAKRGQEIIKGQYGMIVLDELHRTGAKEWEGKIDKLLKNQTEDVKVLGITATPTRDVDERDMANETAKKLGYTDEEISQRKHLASNMTLENAIRMGYVVNPKLVYCKYDLISSGKMDELREKIDDIEDENKREEELQKYNELRQKLNKEIDEEIGEEARKKLEEDARRNLDSGIGKEEILRQNVKKGGKYIVFIPVTDQGDIEDENGNRIGTKTGEDKINAYQDYLNKMFEGTEIVPQLHSLLGSYSKDKNKEELEAFESDNSDKTKFMVVMNKANEGLHIDGVDGIIWFRALDENSRILYLQQLGRAIYALDEDNPLPDDKRPVVIDLANNSLTVKVEKEFENVEPIDDLEALTIVMEWIEQHDGMLPDNNSSNKQEQHYYAVLRRIQNKYSKYLNGFDNFEDLTDEDKLRIQEIIVLASEIDLWAIDLPPIPKTNGYKDEFEPFIVEGILKDFVEFEDEVEKQFTENTRLKKALEIENWCIENYGEKKIWERKLPTSIAKDEEEKRQGEVLTSLKKKMKRYEGQEICSILNEDDRKVIEILRELDRNYAYGAQQLHYNLGQALEIENWCIENYGEKKIWERKLPSQKAKNEEEKRLGRALVNLRQKMKQYEGQEISNISNEDDKRIFEILEKLDREYGLDDSLKNALEIENWCIKNYGEKKIWERKLPISTAKNEEEKRLGRALASLRQKMKQYEGQEISSILNEEDRKIVEVIKRLDREYAYGEYQLHHNLGQILEVENWCIENYGEKQIWKRKLPTSTAKNEEEKRMGKTLACLRKRKKQYEGQEISSISNEEDKNIVEIIRRLDREYAYGETQLYHNLGQILEIENWCIENYGEKKIWKRKLPNSRAENEEEKRLGRVLGTLRQKMKQYEGQEISSIPNEEDRKILEIIERIDSEYGLSDILKNALEIENWCIENYGEKQIWERRLPTKTAKNEEEKRLGIALETLRKRKKQYEGQEISSISNEEDKRIFEMLEELDREYGLGVLLKNALEIENWCIENYGEKQIWERKLPNSKAENKEEKRLGRALGLLKQKMKQYEGQKLEEVENEEDRRILEIIRRLDEEYNPKKFKQKALQQAKQQRDEAKSKNNQAKELEQQVSEQLKKRGQVHDEQ